MEEIEITGDGQKKTWSIGEELLLTCAIKRHGSKNWTSVAMELQARTSQISPTPTPRDCQRKYEDLRRRFIDPDCIVDDENKSGDRTCLPVPWLDELRKLRVHELRQEVIRRDASIQSLQLKVKKLKEERENNVTGHEKPDLEHDDPKQPTIKFEKKNDRCSEEEDHSQSLDKSPSVDESIRGIHSCNESNSTGVKRVDTRAASESGDLKSESQGRRPTIAGNSYKGSTDTQRDDRKEKFHDGAWINAVEESNREGHVESSDMQSSASPSRGRRRRQRGKKKVTTGNEFTEVDGVKKDHDGKINSVESEPWAALLQIIRSHEHGSLFEGSVRSEEYKGIVRKHMDLQTVESRLREGRYTHSQPEFLRDLILLFTNFIVSFPHSSPESTAARELRSLVSHYQHPKQKQTLVSSSNPNSDFDLDSNSLLAKRESSAPIIFCRRRSSLKKSDAEPNPAPPSLSPEQTQPPTTNVRSSVRRRNPTFKKSEKTPRIRKRKRRNASPQPPKRRGLVADFLNRIKLNDSEQRKSSPNPSPSPSPSPSPTPSPRPKKKIPERSRKPIATREDSIAIRSRKFRR